MKVVKNNNKPPQSEYPKKINCTQCNSELEYDKEDLTHTFWRTEGWTNSNIKYRGFVCPCCGYEMGIETLIAS